ncbi:MAG: hypothetical protein Q8J84_07720 [Flavobacteriaceae bacterium]|nr:hypothetical protein [Flavobacteriaceae bacterium]
MKTIQKIKSFVSILLVMTFVLSAFNSNAQEEKQSLSISLTYNKIVDGDSFIKIITSFKGKDGWEEAKNIPFEIYKIGDVETLLGKGMTDMHGVAIYIFPKGIIEAENTIELRTTNHLKFEDTTESLYFKDVNLFAELTLNDDGKLITALLKDNQGNPIAEEGLKVQVRRLIKGLGVGDGTYYTDEAGEISVPIEEDFHSFDGNLIFEVVLEEHDEYGTVRALMNADFGIKGTDLSTFDKRTMWSPVNKTPKFFLIFPNLILLGILGIFLYLIINLKKISKS